EDADVAGQSGDRLVVAGGVEDTEAVVRNSEIHNGVGGNAVRSIDDDVPGDVELRIAPAAAEADVAGTDVDGGRRPGGRNRAVDVEEVGGAVGAGESPAGERVRLLRDRAGQRRAS